jgi:dihydroxy-acid dehydratase
MRSADWYGGNSKDAYIHRAWMRRGNPDSALNGKRPQIAILNTASDLSPCNMHLDEVAQSVKNGIWEAGGVPYNLPMVSLGESNVRPTAALWRNMVAMSTEEMIRANPVDGVVLLGGCDKTIPALLMGAASVNLPAIVISGGPMLNGTFKGKLLGCGTGVWKFSEEVRAGKMSQEDFYNSEKSMIRSKGHCNTMGTASTMASMAELLGMSLPGLAGIPAADSRLFQGSHESGVRIVKMVEEDLKPSDIMTKAAFHNAIVALGAIGGSTNAVVHLLARIPLLVNLQPAGDFLMEDLFRAGGLTAVMKEVERHLDRTAVTVTGKPYVDSIKNAEIFDETVIKKYDAPLQPEAGIAVLRGNIAPDGAVIKPAAASQELLVHTGKAVIFESIEDFHARIDDPNLDVDEDSVLVLRGCGPRGYPGMPEVSNMALPKKLLEKGIVDLVRICDGRMSGTAFGTVVLHVSPEGAVGGPLSKLQNGDVIELNVPERTLNVKISDEELAARQPSAAMMNALAKPLRGWERLFVDHVEQSHLGADLDFLRGASGSKTPRESH